MFEKYINTKFHENPFGGGRVVPCGRSDGQKNMAKLRVAFRNFTKPPNNDHSKNKFENYVKTTKKTRLHK